MQVGRQGIVEPMNRRRHQKRRLPDADEKEWRNAMSL
jgi:hypothetical protein